ncbi:hypothetical protein AVEN_67760-1 [Araneus ventricosus]|uniref:F-box domain-containing protein n=1 Tax=Araneus ventricosus TaxID=182803 RepID=A0A4Y2UTB9_ARAVE|nr:hypothetical protein AVEN_67760-1 [Araneus ventricosus]
MGMESNVLFDRLLACKTNDHLVALQLWWTWSIPDLFSTLIPFLQACKNLKCFELSIVPPTNGLDRLLESWLVNRPESLEKVIIDISYMREEDCHPSF